MSGTAGINIFYANEITLFIRENKLTLRGILLTHGHYDHYSSDEVLVNNFETKIYCPLKEKNVILNHNFSKEIVGEIKIINENNYVFFEGKELIVYESNFIKRIIKKIKTSRHHFLYDAERDCVIEEMPNEERELWSGWVFLVNHLEYVI